MRQQQKVANKKVEKQHILDAPLGVRGRNSNNDLVREKLGWDYSQTLEEGIRKTYNWICLQLYNTTEENVLQSEQELELLALDKMTRIDSYEDLTDKIVGWLKDYYFAT